MRLGDRVRIAILRFETSVGPKMGLVVPCVQSGYLIPPKDRPQISVLRENATDFHQSAGVCPAAGKIAAGLAGS